MFLTSDEIPPEPFVVRHYSGDEGPILKGNGFDGLRIGNDREEAEEFVAWLNARLGGHPVGIVSRLVKGGVIWWTFPDEMPDGTTLCPSKTT